MKKPPRLGLHFVAVPPRNIPTAYPIADEEILRLWADKKDTYDIATLLGLPEHDVERRLHQAREAEREDAEWQRSGAS